MISDEANCIICRKTAKHGTVGIMAIKPRNGKLFHFLCTVFSVFNKNLFVCLQTGQGSGSLLSLSDAVNQAARTAGVRPITSAEQLQGDLDSQEVKEAYSEQVTMETPSAF